MENGSNRPEPERLEGLVKRAENAAKASGLPGWHNGPADAFRHIVASAEATRRYGAPIAFGLGEDHEYRGSRDGQPADEARMDRRNNAIGIGIGADAASFDEIVARTKAVFVDAAAGGNQDVPVWLARDRWGGGSKDVEPDERKRISTWAADPDVRAARTLQRPVEDWGPDDVRAVQGSSVYFRENPRQASAFAKVWDWYGRTRTDNAPGAGSVPVRSYRRDDGTQVSGHSRAAPQCGDGPQ
jgi:hypothetical protein